MYIYMKIYIDYPDERNWCIQRNITQRQISITSHFIPQQPSSEVHGNEAHPQPEPEYKTK